MKMKTGFAAAVVFALVQSGCIVASRNTGTVSAPTPIAEPVEAEATISQAKLLNVRVEGAGGSGGAGNIAGDLKRAVAGALATKGFAVDADHSDISVALAAETSVFDQSGNYYRYDGKVVARVERTMDRRLLGEQTFEGRGERKLGSAGALSALSSSLSGKVVDWVAETIAPAQAGLAANNITVTRKHAKTDDAEYARIFATKAGALKGVVSCTLASQDTGAHSMVFRVVYLKDAFPAGILNHVAGIPELELKSAK